MMIVIDVSNLPRHHSLLPLLFLFPCLVAPLGLVPAARPPLREWAKMRRTIT